MVRVRWLVLAAGLGLVVVGAVWGIGVFGDLEGGGFEDPASESSRAADRVTSDSAARMPTSSRCTPARR